MPLILASGAPLLLLIAYLYYKYKCCKEDPEKKLAKFIYEQGFFSWDINTHITYAIKYDITEATIHKLYKCNMIVSSGNGWILRRK